jgi:hypothetical protein
MSSLHLNDKQGLESLAAERGSLCGFDIFWRGSTLEKAAPVSLAKGPSWPVTLVRRDGRAHLQRR